jgi:hypothetical protein
VSVGGVLAHNRRTPLCPALAVCGQRRAERYPIDAELIGAASQEPIGDTGFLTLLNLHDAVQWSRSVHFAINCAISRLFFSSIIMWPFP